MMRNFLDPHFTERQRRLGGYLETAIWLVSTTLLVALVSWSAGASAFG